MTFPHTRYFYCNFSRGFPVFSPSARRIDEAGRQRLLDAAMAVQHSQRVIVHEGFGYQIGFTPAGGLAEIAALNIAPLQGRRIPTGTHLARFSLNVVPENNLSFFHTLADDYLQYSLAHPDMETESIPAYFPELTKVDGQVPLVLAFNTEMGARLSNPEFGGMTRGAKDILAAVMPSVLQTYLSHNP